MDIISPYCLKICPHLDRSLHVSFLPCIIPHGCVLYLWPNIHNTHTLSTHIIIHLPVYKIPSCSIHIKYIFTINLYDTFYYFITLILQRIYLYTSRRVAYSLIQAFVKFPSSLQDLPCIDFSLYFWINMQLFWMQTNFDTTTYFIPQVKQKMRI